MPRARGARRVAVEDPSLDDAWATIHSAGPEVVGLPVNEDGVRVDGPVAAGLHLVRAPPGTDEAPVAARRRIAIRGLASYSLSPQPPALVVGYGRLPLAAIDAAVGALATALVSP